MINEETLLKLYDGVLNNQELTTKELNSYGFSSNDLTQLINKGVIERVKRGYYTFNSVDDLFSFGKKLISMKEYYKATKCFEKCYELNPNHAGVCFQLFLRCIKDKNYEKAFEYFDNFYNSENEHYNHDSNYYLYLLNMITELPEKHRKYAKSLKLKDIRVDSNDKRYSNNTLHNKIRISSLNQRFIFASKQLNEAIKENNGRMTVQDIIIRILLDQAIEEQFKIKEQISKLVNKKDYDLVIKILENMRDKHDLTPADEYTLSLIKDIVSIMKTGKIPKKQVPRGNILFDAIDSKNYELALSLSEEYTKRQNIDTNDNIIYVLLVEIKNLIDMGKNKDIIVKEEQITETIIPVKSETEKQIGEGKITTNGVSNNITFADVVSYLMKHDLDNAFRSLRSYLNKIGKKEYEFLIIDLIKISLLENDIAFTKPMIALNYVARENFEFNISEYIQNFYETLAQNKFDQARVYLDIISKSNDLGQHCILTEGLKTVLDNTEKLSNHKENKEILNSVEESIKNAENNGVSIIEAPKKEETEEQPIIETSKHSEKKDNNDDIKNKQTSIETKQLKNKNYNDVAFINSKLDEVRENGIVLLKPMDDGRIKEIHNIVKNIKDVVSFSIGDNNKKQVVLRYKTYMDEYVDIKELIQLSKEAYTNGDYDGCININKQLLKFGNPRARVYASMGVAYMKKYDKKNAVDYLTIATELSKKEDGRFDFTDTILYLSGLVSEEDAKPRFKMSESDFNDNIDEHYGIENIKEVAKLISSGISIDDACTTVGINDEKKNIVMLIFAREYYALENYTLGDKYLKSVERSKTKSKTVNKLLDEVRRNKRFYKNKVREDQKFLMLANIDKK